MDDVLILLTPTKTQDRLGVWQETLTERTVFCQWHSVTRAEFFDAGRNGLNPEFQFTIFHGDYAGETLCRYAGQAYSIYRTYRGPNSDYLELYVERKGGSNGAAAQGNS